MSTWDTRERGTTIVEKYSWNSHSKACMMGECEDFTPDEILNVDGFHGKKDVKLFKWCRENKSIGKIKATLKCDTAIKTWTPSVVNLKQHIHRKRIQVFYLNSIKKDLKNTDVLLHVDFTDSYKNACKGGIQSAYFGQSYFFIFRACADTCTNGQICIMPITVTTEWNEHSCVTSLSCIHKIVIHTEEW